MQLDVSIFSKLAFPSLILLIFPSSFALSDALIEINGMDVGSIPMGVKQKIVISPNDTGAAVLEFTGPPNTIVEFSVPKDPFNKRSGFMVLKKFTFGGSLTKTGKTARGTTDGTGYLGNIRIGATNRIYVNTVNLSRVLNIDLDYGPSLIGSFSANGILVNPVTFLKLKDMNFPGVELLKVRQNIILLPANGAHFQLNGGPNFQIQVSLPRSVSLTNLLGDTIKVKKFTFGGGVDRRGNGQLNNTGFLELFIGATAEVRKGISGGTYSGVADLTVVYQ